VSFILADKSFSEMFTTYSHLLLLRLPAGLRLETSAKIDKKKTEIYFLSPQKKILTEKENERVPEWQI